MAVSAGCAHANIPEAIHHPWGLSLVGSWPELHGPHLTFLASEDIHANGPMVAPPTLFDRAQEQQ
jgi:hypothetical protein